MAGEEDGEEAKPKQSPWADLLTAAGKQLMPVLLTGASLIGFVAFAGAVIVWTRFSAAKVPADQAVAALPQDELVAIGSSLLLLFGFFGALAVLAVFLIDRGGRATPGMSRGLLLLLMAEGAVAVVLVDGPSLEESIVAIQLFLLPMAVVFWSTFATPFIRLNEDLPDRVGEDEPEAELQDGPFLRVGGGFALSPDESALTLAIPTNCAAVGAGMTLLLFGGSSMTAALVGLAILGAGLALMVGLHCNRFYGDKVRRDKEKQRKQDREQRRRREREQEEELEERLLAEGDWREAATLRRAHQARKAFAGADSEDLKPPRLELTGSGKLLMAVMTTGAVAGPALLFGKIWLAVALVSALVLIAGLWRIADLAEARFMWYGLAVFISLPLFGTLMLMARNIDDPQVQPVALIRDTDGPEEAIQGLYVTEGDDRVYFATVSTEGCSDRLTPHSGRLLWVPKSEVVAMSIGPLQSVEDAAKTSLEMAYALTPAVETLGGSHAGPTTPARDTVEAQIANGKPEEDHRLKNVGVAVRPNFGAGWSVSPPTASPGDVVTLRMSAANDERGVEGFGLRRGGRTLRLGGVRVDVLKERAPSPWDAEYVETNDGAALKLEKGKVFVKTGTKRDPSFEEVDERPDEERLYVKLVDKSVVSVTPGRKVEASAGEEAGLYLPLRQESQPSLLARLDGKRRGAHEDESSEATQGDEANENDKRPVAETKVGDEVRLEYRLLRQAWHKDHIRFRVPENAGSGPVTVECNQLAGQPLLQVSRPPEARIAVQMQAGSDRFVFDSHLSRDHDGEIDSRRWTIEGIGQGNDLRIAENLPPRDTPYTVRLTVTDAEHHSDTAEVRLFRLLPEQLDGGGGDGGSSGGASASSAPAGPPQLHAILANSVAKEADSELEMDAYASRPGSSSEGNVEAAEALSRKAVRHLLTKIDLPATFPTGGIPVRELAYGDRCPPALGEDVRRRIDVFILRDGTQVLPPEGCHPGRVENTDW